MDEKLKRKIAIEVGAVHKAAKEGKDETIRSTDNLLALIASYSREARIKELQRLYEQADDHGIVRVTKTSLTKRIMKLNKPSSNGEVE